MLLIHPVLVLFLHLLFSPEELDSLLDVEALKESCSVLSGLASQGFLVVQVYDFGLCVFKKLLRLYRLHAFKLEDAVVVRVGYRWISVGKEVIDVLCELLSMPQVHTDFLSKLADPIEIQIVV